MTSTFTTNLALNLQATGDNPNSWGTVLNNNVFTIVDQALGSKLSLSVAGSANVTLSTTQSQNFNFNFTGVLTGNINVIYPASAGRIIWVQNNTTGAFTLTVKPSGGSGVAITQGSAQLVVIDGVAGTATLTQSSSFTGNTTITGNLTVTGSGTYGAQVNFAKGSDVASGTTTNIGAATGNYLNVTGTTTITAFDTVQAGTWRMVNFTGILTLTNNGTSLILPGGANITTAAGDKALFISLGSGNWVCATYQLAAVAPSGGFLKAASNLSDLNSASTARTNLGLGTAATLASTAVLQASNNLGDLGTLSTALTNLGFVTQASTNGSLTFPGGLIMKFGNAGTGGSGTVTFTNAFPNNIFCCFGNGAQGSPSSGVQSGFSTSSFTFANASGNSFCWIAIGN